MNRKKIKNIIIILLVLLVLLVLFLLTGCKSITTTTKENVENTNSNKEFNNKIIGTWKLNSNIRVNDSEYIGLHSLIGDSYGSDTLVINEDGTFSLSAGMIYNLKGTYKFENEELIFSNLEDINITNEEALVDIEKNLKLEYIEYKGNEFFKMFLYDFTDFEGYIFYEKVETKEEAERYPDDLVPEVIFNNTKNSNNESDDLTQSNLSSEYKELVGSYENNQGTTFEIIAESNGDLYLSNGEDKCKIDTSDNNITNLGSSGYIIKISDVSSVVENATAIYIYPQGVSFSLSDNPATYEEFETDSTKCRLFVKNSSKLDYSSVYYKK